MFLLATRRALAQCCGFRYGPRRPWAVRTHLQEVMASGLAVGSTETHALQGVVPGRGQRVARKASWFANTKTTRQRLVP